MVPWKCFIFVMSRVQKKKKKIDLEIQTFLFHPVRMIYEREIKVTERKREIGIVRFVLVRISDSILNVRRV